MGDEPKERAVRMYLVLDNNGNSLAHEVEAVAEKYRQVNGILAPGVFLPMSLYERVKEDLQLALEHAQGRESIIVPALKRTLEKDLEELEIDE